MSKVGESPGESRTVWKLILSTDRSTIPSLVAFSLTFVLYFVLKNTHVNVHGSDAPWELAGIPFDWIFAAYWSFTSGYFCGQLKLACCLSRGRFTVSRA